MKQDEDRLTHMAKQINSTLQEQGHGRQIRGGAISRPKRTHTDGWKVRIGGLGRGKPLLELWLDRFPGRGRRYFWWGFFSPNQKAIPWLMKRLPHSLQPTLPILIKDHYGKVGRSSWLLKQPLKRQEFDQPIEERYRVDRFYGVYDNTLASDQIIVRRAGNFFARILCYLFGTTPVANDVVSDGLPAWVKQTVNRIVRDTETSREIKQLYGFRCQVCWKGLEIEPGEFYAEAHHLQPLGGEHKGPDVRENLLCLCPNHHALFDFFALPLNPARLKLHKHKLGTSFVNYHNKNATKSHVL